MSPLGLSRLRQSRPAKYLGDDAKANAQVQMGYYNLYTKNNVVEIRQAPMLNPKSLGSFKDMCQARKHDRRRLQERLEMA